MKRLKHRPSSKQLKLIAIALAAVLLAAFLTLSAEISTFMLVVVALVVLLDFVLSRFARKLTVELECSQNMALQRFQPCAVIVSNLGDKALNAELSIVADNAIELKNHQQTLALAPREKAKLSNKLKAHKRGDCQIAGIEVRITSPFSLWQTSWFVETPLALKVYPDFSRINTSHSLNGVVNKPIDGLKLTKKRGEGIEFHQLREFRQGDSVKQIDWQATSKRRKLISREYQEEQNQHVIVMLDASKKMNIEAEHGSHFDHALNALLMLAHTVLKQGDWFSMQSFNRDVRWLANVKGGQNVSRVMNHFYDLYPDQSAADYLSAVNQLLTKRTKRSLVLLVTTLDEQSVDELLPAVKLLQKHHLVALVNINHQGVSGSLVAPITEFKDANQYCAALSLLNEHKANMARLRKEGVIAIDCQPEHLLPYVINTYLNVKHSGAL